MAGKEAFISHKIRWVAVKGCKARMDSACRSSLLLNRTVQSGLRDKAPLFRSMPQNLLYASKSGLYERLK